METFNSLDMETSQIFDLGYAVINFEDESIIWKQFGFTPKRRNLILSYFNAGHLDFYAEVINNK